jgi:hypothetical protein
MADPFIEDYDNIRAWTRACALLLQNQLVLVQPVAVYCMFYPGYFILRVHNIAQPNRAFAIVVNTRFKRDPHIDMKSRNIRAILTVSHDISCAKFTAYVTPYIRDICECQPIRSHRRHAAHFQDI